MTTHRDRIEACLQGKTVDRPPVALWRHFPVDDQSSESLAAAHVAFQQLFDFDLVKITPASSFSVRDWGVEDAWEGDPEGTRTYTKTVIHEPGDWERLKVLEPSSPALASQLECIRLIRGRLGAETPLLQTVFNPLAQAKHLAGDRLLCQQLQTHPESVQQGLRTITDSTRAFIEAAASAGIDGIFYAVQHAQSHLLSTEQFVRFSREADLILLRAAGGLWFNMLHIHGVDIYFSAVSDYPVHAVNWHDRETSPGLGDVGVSGPPALCGGLSRRTLVYGTPKDVAAEAEEAFAALELPRLILSTGCVVPLIAPYGNMMAARQAAEAAAARGSSRPAR